MAAKREIVITGVGVVSPTGVGCELFWQSLMEGRSGVQRLDLFDGSRVPPALAAQVRQLDIAKFVRPRKALKVMGRDIQLGFVAADLACSCASLQQGTVDPERLGIVFGADMMTCELDEMVAAYRRCLVDGRFDFSRWGTHALDEMFPLWMLKYLPNMPACHISIAHDARGPNNSLVLGEVSSLAAIAEAMRVIERGQADVMIAGGTGCRTHSAVWARRKVYELSSRVDHPEAACRPFDADRDGAVHGEGAGAFVLESRTHAEARGARILARILGYFVAYEPHRPGLPLEGTAIRSAIRLALDDAGVTPREIGHVNAHGMSTRLDDRIEAQAIRHTLGEVPVTAPKSFFGNLAAGGGAVEMAASVLAFHYGRLPFTLNYEKPDPQCPIFVVRGEPAELGTPTAVVLNHAATGQAVAMVIASPDW